MQIDARSLGRGVREIVSAMPLAPTGQLSRDIARCVHTHVFQGKTQKMQKTQKTDERDLEIGRKRYQEHAEFEMTNTFRIPNGVPYGAPEEPPR
jgi:phage-related protein